MIPQVSEGIQYTSAVRPVGMPQVGYCLAGGGGLLHVVKAHIDSGGVNRMILQKLRIQRYSIGRLVGKVQRNGGVIVISHRIVRVDHVVEDNLDPIPGIGSEDQRRIFAASAFVLFHFREMNEQQTLRVMIPVAVIHNVRLDSRQLEPSHHRSLGRGQWLRHGRGIAFAQRKQVLLRAAICPQDAP